jgi:hypothetical protein
LAALARACGVKMRTAIDFAKTCAGLRLPLMTVLDKP